MPPIIDIAVALDTKGSVQMTAVGIPFFSNVIPSCTLHDEQEPQSPEAVMTMSHSCAKSLRISGGHGLEALPLLYSRDFFRLCSFDKISYTHRSNSSEFFFPFESSPTVDPSSDSGLSAIADFSDMEETVGSSTFTVASVLIFYNP